MRKFIVPLTLCMTVLCITYRFQTFTLLRQEGLGLFLNTPDFYRALFLDPLPVSSLIGSFLVQFYTNHIVGVLIFTGMVMLSFILTMLIVRNFCLRLEIFGAIVACVFWWFFSHASSPTLGVAMLLGLSIVLAIITLCRRVCLRRNLRCAHISVSKLWAPPVHNAAGGTGCSTGRSSGWWNIILSVLIIAISAIFIVTDSKLREVEKWSKVEFAAVQGDWNYLLKTATPEAARKDPGLVPYALLALNAQGRLTLEEMSKYPLASDFGLDYGDELSYRSCLFASVLYSNLGCPNEAIHRTHQSGDFLYHGTSFRTLRMLVKENYALQDSLMVVKYCDILDRSMTHGKFVQYFREHPCPLRPVDSPEKRSRTPLTVSKDQMETMLQIGRAGINSGMAMERYYAYYQLKQYFESRK